MTASIQLTDFERHLYAEMVQCMAMDLAMPYEIINLSGGKSSYGPRDQLKDRKGGKLQHYSLSKFKQALKILEKFGIVIPANQDGAPAEEPNSAHSWVLVIDGCATSVNFVSAANALLHRRPNQLNLAMTSTLLRLNMAPYTYRMASL